MIRGPYQRSRHFMLIFMMNVYDGLEKPREMWLSI